MAARVGTHMRTCYKLVAMYYAVNVLVPVLMIKNIDIYR